MVLEKSHKIQLGTQPITISLFHINKQMSTQRFEEVVAKTLHETYKPIYLNRKTEAFVLLFLFELTE